ncbi:MAG TPA: hypothetical protein VKB29_10975 [Candidatus Binataceae bacterium]|nr:hypothetical protein [Candidatus Binataceae bacterium]
MTFVILVADVQCATVQKFDQVLIDEYAQPVLFGLLVAWTGLFGDSEADGLRAFAGVLIDGAASDTNAGFASRALDGLCGFQQRRGSLGNSKHMQPPAIIPWSIGPNAPTFVVRKDKLENSGATSRWNLAGWQVLRGP